MAFLLSRCVGLVTPDPGGAAAFYQAHFDMTSESSEVSVELCGGPIRMFLDPGRPRPLVFEMITDDLLEARHFLRQFGFEELVWRGVGQSCLVRDPFGLVFNIHEDRHAFFPATLRPPAPGFIKGCLGGQVVNPNEAARYYANILESTASKLADGSSIVDSGVLRLRFRKSEESRPLVWLRSEAPIEQLHEAGCHFDQDGCLWDPFGVAWCIEAASPAPSAVCCPL